MKDQKYGSVCCGELMPDYPDSDFCPRCKEHTSGFTQEQIEAEEGETGRLLKRKMRLERQ